MEVGRRGNHEKVERSAVKRSSKMSIKRCAMDFTTWKSLRTAYGILVRAVWVDCRAEARLKSPVEERGSGEILL